MKVEIIMENSTHEVDCSDIKLQDGMIMVFDSYEKVIEMWNASKIVGVIIE